jgi:glycosyltransferase involved in cell wall biosynthesis
MTLPQLVDPRALSTALPIASVSVVIPTLNEADNLRLLLPNFPGWIDEIIVVDGRSTDGTVRVAEAFARERRLSIVMEPRKGKGAALRAGFRAARSDIIVALDADCSMHPCEIPLLVAALMAGADYAKGSRFIQGAGTADMSWFRSVGNWGLTQIVNALYGGSFSDLCYGYFAFWRRHLSVLDPACDGFEVETFIEMQALKAKLRIAEVPSFEALRIHGASNLRAIPDGMRVLRTILRERWSHPRPAENSFGMADPQSLRRFAAAIAKTDGARVLPTVASSADPETTEMVS